MPKYLNTKPGSLESAVLEAVSPAQQAAIAISKKEKGEKPKDEKDEGNAFGAALQAAKEKGEKTFTVAGKKYDVKTEEDKLDKVNPVAVKKKFDDRKDKDIDNDGDVDSTDKYLHKRRKAISKAVKDEDLDEGRMKELHGYMEKGMSAQEIAKKMKLDVKTIEALMDEKEPVAEKVEYVEYKFKNKNDAMKAKSYFDGIQLMSFDVNDDAVGMGELAVDAGNKDMTKYHKEVMKKFKPKVMTQEKKEEVKEENSLAERSARAITAMWKDASPKTEEEEPKKKEEKDAKTMTGKPMTKVEVSPSDEAGKK